MNSTSPSLTVEDKGVPSHRAHSLRLRITSIDLEVFTLPSRTTSKLRQTARMVSKVLFWGGFGTFPTPSSSCLTLHAGASSIIKVLTGIGVAVRLWQLGLEMRPFFNRGSLWVYPIFAGTGASFGYWMQGVEQRQYSILQARKEKLLEKRARRAELEVAEES
jgi:hypothetical protein